jgi:hypothetical protein
MQKSQRRIFKFGKNNVEFPYAEKSEMDFWMWKKKRIFEFGKTNVKFSYAKNQKRISDMQKT